MGKINKENPSNKNANPSKDFLGRSGNHDSKSSLISKDFKTTVIKWEWRVPSATWLNKI